MRDLLSELQRPFRLWSHDEIFGEPCPVPAEGGTYGWHFTTAPHPALDAGRLLYIGVSPGSATSRETLRSRIKYHFRGDAEGSTVRLTVGCLLGFPCTGWAGRAR
ncbi:GIY-YIG nuclease family protein [Actinokineospora soli]|uniref:GIY-YIG nuclease family protein n=1 Tax=Actinokineospora soli TaxID=1048753 RepID=A0ABW2TMD7_9PSEU